MPIIVNTDAHDPSAVGDFAHARALLQRLGVPDELIVNNDLEKLKRQIGTNIALQRKNAGLTQVGLAEKLNYSDKAVSKWERGDSMPDILTLVLLSELFEGSVDDLLSDPNALPGNPGSLEKAMSQV